MYLWMMVAVDENVLAAELCELKRVLVVEDGAAVGCGIFAIFAAHLILGAEDVRVAEVAEIGFDVLVEVGLLQTDDVAVEAHELLEQAPHAEVVPVEGRLGRALGAQHLLLVELLGEAVPLHDAELPVDLDGAARVQHRKRTLQYARITLQLQEQAVVVVVVVVVVAVIDHYSFCVGRVALHLCV